MRRHTGAAGALIAIAAILPLAGIAHAQDLDCRDFRSHEEAQAEYDRDPSDPHGLDEDQGPDDGIACEILPRVGTAISTPAPITPVPVTPVPVTTAPVTTAPATLMPATTAPASVTPTMGVRGGLGGATGSWLNGWETAAGLTLATGGAVAAAYVVRRRRG